MTEFVEVGTSPTKGEREETKYRKFIEFVRNIKPGTGEGIVVAESEVKGFQVIAIALDCRKTYGSYRIWRMKDRTVETRTTKVDGGVRLDVYVEEVKDE